MQKVSKSHRDRQGPIWPGELVPEVVIGSELDGLLGGDQEDVDTAAPVHPKVALTKYSISLVCLSFGKLPNWQIKIRFLAMISQPLFVCFVHCSFYLPRLYKFF